ncbi:MAG: isopentenyl phosphate kinase [archaeon GBS-70-058]|nr:isopentenyl phosphate kinase [Candidatus Culexarchaeum nevadense]
MSVIVNDKKLIVIKLGGSVVTQKSEYEVANVSVIRRIASELAEIMNTFSFIIVHGGGSFGHPHAYKHKLNEGFRDISQLPGVLETHHAMLRLNEIIVNEFLNAGFIPFPFQPSSMITTKKGEIFKSNTYSIGKAIKLGFTPILYGDVVFDDEYGFYILSGDKICSYLAIEFNAAKVVFSCDVDGIYTSDPKCDPNSKLIETLTLDDLSELIRNWDSRSASRIDVTGGMKNKLLEAEKICSSGIEVCIVNALVPGRIVQAIVNTNFYGSRIVPSLK